MKPKEKVVWMVSQYWDPDILGDVSRLKQIISTLVERGYQVRLIAGAPHYPEGAGSMGRRRLFRFEREGDVLVFRVPMPPLPHRGFLNRLILYSWFAALALIPTTAFARDGFVWTFGQRIFSTFSALPAKFLWGRKVVSDVTDVWPHALVNTRYTSDGSFVFRFGMILARTAYRNCDAVTTIADTMKAIIVKEYGTPERRVFVLPYIWRGGAGPAAKGSVFRVLYYGNVGSNYDFRIVCDAAALLKSDDVEFVIRGNGDKLPRLKEDLAALDATNVRLITGYLSQEDLYSLIASSDALIIPMEKQVYRDASFPGKFVEFLYAKKPIIYVGDGLPSDLIVRYGLGAVVGYGDPGALRASILSLRGDPERAARMGENASRLAAEKFSAEALRTSVGGVLDAVAGGAP